MSEMIKTSLLTNQSADSLLFLEFKTRLQWMSSVLLYLFISISFFIFLWIIISKTPGYYIFSLAVLFIFISALELSYLIAITPSSSPLNQIFRFTFNLLNASNLYSLNTLTLIHLTLDFINFLTIIVVPLSTLTACLIIKNKIENSTQLYEQTETLKNFVKGASAMMIAGLIHMQL